MAARLVGVVTEDEGTQTSCEQEIPEHDRCMHEAPRSCDTYGGIIIYEP